MLLQNVHWPNSQGAPIHGQTKIQLHLWVYKTSCRQLPVPTMYLCDGLEHIPPLFKPIHMICFFLLLQTASHYTQTTYTYDLSITFIRSQAQGCLTTKNLYNAKLFECSGKLFFLKLFFSLFVTFLLFVTFINYFLLLRRVRVYIVFIVRGGKGCTLIYFLLFYYYWRGKGAEVNVFFSPSLEMWKELLPQYLILKRNMWLHLCISFLLV